MILVTLGGLVFLFPVAVYCFLLASINRRRHPVMLPGNRDFVEVLTACSGFLLFGGPCILTSFDQRWRDYWFYGRVSALHGMSNSWWNYWFALLALYLLVIAGAAWYLLRRRRLVTAIYNIHPKVLQEKLAEVLDRLLLDWQQSDQRIFIGYRADPERPGRENQKLVLEIDPVPALRHVTLHWPSDAGLLRMEIEHELARACLEVTTPDNPVGTWMSAIAWCLCSVMFFFVVFLGTVLYYLFR